MKNDFFNAFRCEILTSTDENKVLIKNFKANDKGKTLEDYLKNQAWDDTVEGETKVYLVKDKRDQIVLFFSIRCGLLYENSSYSKLNDAELDFVDSVTEAYDNDNQEALAGYFDYGKAVFGDQVNNLFIIAQEKRDLKNEKKLLNEKENVLNVNKCYPAIEIQHLCKNIVYESIEETKVSICFGVFWELIVPHILELTERIGCKYIYLFAAEKEIGSNKKQKLIQFYKNELMFSEVNGITIIKPDYDRNCYGLIQSIEDLIINKETIWERFSDII